MTNSYFHVSRIIVTTLLLLISCWAVAEPAVRVTVLLSGESQLYYNAVEGITERLDESVGLDYDITTLSEFNTNSAGTINNNSDYIIAVGSKAVRYVSKVSTSASVLNILVSKRSYQSMLKSQNNDNQASVIYLDQPAERLLLLTKFITENHAAKVGMLFGPTSVAEKSSYVQAAKRSSMQLISKTETSGASSLDAIESLIISTDMYVALYDREVLNRKTAKWLLYLANVHRRPVVAYSKSYVEAGAVAAVYTTPADAGRSAGDWLIENIKNNSKNKVVWKKHPEIFTININRNIATKLNLSIDKSDVIRDKIVAAEVRK